MPSKDLIRLHKAVQELNHRKKINPLRFFEPFPIQKLFNDDPAKTRGIFGGNRPLAYGTLVNTGPRPTMVEGLKVGDDVCCWTGTGMEVKPTKVIDIPFDGYCDVFRIHSVCGITVESSYDHCFLSKIKENGRYGRHTVEELHNSDYKKLFNFMSVDGIEITNIERIGTKKCRCITIDHPHHTFLLANGLITYNSGKTQDVSYYVIKKCVDKPKQRWWAVAETFQDSINIQQKKIWELLPKTDMRYCKYNEVLGFTNRKIIFKNGSSIQFKSFDQGTESFMGDAVHGIWLDEESPYDIYKECRMRLIDFDGEMLLSMTSLKGMTDLMSEIYENCDVLRSDPAPLLDNMELPRIAEKDGIKLYFLWTSENKHINQERVQQEARYLNKEETKSRLYGIPVGVAGRVYPMFNRDIHVITFEKVPDRQVTLYHVLDPHDRKPWAMTWWAVHKNGEAYCVWEYPMHKNFNEMDTDDKTFDDYSRLIKDTEAQLLEYFGRSVHKRIIDPNFGNSTRKLSVRQGGQSSTTVKKEMARRGLRFKDGIDSIQTGHIQCKKWLHWAEKDGEIIVHPKVYFADHCMNTIRHVSRYSHGDVETASGDMRDKVKPKEKWKDYADNFRYFCSSNPVYIPPQSSVPESSGRVY